MKKNIEFDFDDPVLQALFKEVLIPYLYKNGDTPTSQGRFLAEKAKQYQIGIKQSELTANLFKPYLAGSSCRISVKYCEGLVNLLQKLRIDKELTDDKDVIANFGIYYKEKSRTQNPKQTQFSFLGQDSFEVQELNMTDWWLFERIGDDSNRNTIRGIFIRKVSFSNQGRLMTCKVLFSSQEAKVFENYGIATHDDSKDYIYVDLLSKDGTKKRSSLVLRLAEAYRDEQNILIGHYTYHSVRYQHLVTKTVVLQKKTADYPTKIGSYFFGSSDYNEIPKAIRQFLYPRERNRMSFPNRIITSLKTLEIFLTSSREEKVSKTIKNHFCGEYYIYYTKNESDLREDKLSIIMNEESVQLECVYKHYFDTQKKVPKYFLGKPYHNDRKMIIELSNEKTSEDKRENPILLSFNLPDHFESSECFPGILSGLSDADLSPAAYRVLVVKSSIKKEMINYEDLINIYFEKFDSNTLYPPDEYFSLLN